MHHGWDDYGDGDVNGGGQGDDYAAVNQVAGIH
jgi:hypothetical protein